MCGCATFIVIFLIMHISYTLVCCAPTLQKTNADPCITCSRHEHCNKQCHKSRGCGQAEKSQTHSKRDTSSIDQPHTKPGSDKETYSIIDNEIPKDDIDPRDSSEIETQTYVTLIFLNASYATTEAALNTQTQKDLEEISDIELGKSAQKPSTLVEEPKTPPPLVTKTHIRRKGAPKESCGRGILDLLLPPERVHTFKTYFEAFKRFLSATF